MPTLLYDSKHWRQKANEMRTAADSAGNGADQIAFSRLASDYEALAVRAETRAGKEPKA